MAVQDKSGGGPIVIKKYANRRLYNTAKSSYVTLEDLAQMVREGSDFSVFDAKSGDDITRSVLTQIIFEEEAKGQNLLPINFLRQLIRLYGDALQGVVPPYLEASMDTFARNQERMREAFSAGNPLANFEALTRSNMEWFEQAVRMFTPFGQKAMAEARREEARLAGEAAPEPATAVSQDLEALQRQMQEMQLQIEKLTRERGEPGEN